MTTATSVATLERHTIKLPEGLMERTLREVLSLGQGADGFACGRVEDPRQLPPAAAELDALLREELIDPLSEREGRNFSMSFIKAGDGDAPPEQMFAPAAMDAAPHVFRVLLNLSEYPRRVLLWEGERADEVLIPGRRCGAIHALHYPASAIPNCGVNDALGYFTVSYEAPL